MGNFDGGWKLAVTRFFPLFMKLLFNDAYCQIDWKRGFVSLDKELEALFPKGKSGRKHVDLLFKVWLNDGSEQWVLVHIEVQSQRVADFERVMYEYNYRVYDRYKHSVASFAVLADEHPSWRPSRFEQNLLGFKLVVEFPTAKLLDLGDAWLESQNNPIAILILAHRKAQETHGRPGERKLSKLKLIRGLYEGGLSREDVQEMFRIINWMIDLPEKLELQLRHDIEQIEMEKQVTYLSSMDRAVMALGAREGRKKGLLEAISVVAAAKFGSAVAKRLTARLGNASIDRLKKVQLAVATATSAEELNRVLPPAGMVSAPRRRTARK